MTEEKTKKAPAAKAKAAAPKAAAKAPAAKKAAPGAAKTGAMVTVRQTKSAAGRVQVQHATLRGLGLKGPHTTKTLQDTPEVRGMIRAVAHLVEVVE